MSIKLIRITNTNS